MIGLRPQTAWSAQRKSNPSAMMLLGWLFLLTLGARASDDGFGSAFKNASNVRAFVWDKTDKVFEDICPIPSEGDKKRNLIYFCIIANGVGMPQKMIVLFKVLEEQGKLNKLQQVLKHTDTEGMNILRYISWKRELYGHDAEYVKTLIQFDRIVRYYMNKGPGNDLDAFEREVRK